MKIVRSRSGKHTKSQTGMSDIETGSSVVVKRELAAVADAGVKASPPAVIHDQSLDKLERSIRHGFVRKVMAYLLIEIALCMGVVCIFVYTPGVANYCQHNSWPLFASVLVCVVSMLLASMYTQHFNQVHSYNLVVCFLVSMIVGVFLGVLSATLVTENPVLVWIAFGTTMGIMLVLGAFAVQTSYDFSGIGPYLFVSSYIVLVFGCLGGFFAFSGLLWIGLVVALLSMYVVYDMQKILGGKHNKFQFSVDESASASLALLTDFTLLFSVVLCCSQGMSQ
jgi:FtsH-binding integral membrane protein